MSYPAGNLRHRVTIQQQVETRNEFGEIAVSWQDFATVWAAIEPLSAREFVQSQAMQSQVTTRIVIRSIAGLTPKMRISASGKLYDIAGALPDKWSGLEYVTLPCTDGTSDGR